jgi:chromosome segregation ATPase
MKKILFIPVAITTVLTGIIFPSCQSSVQKEKVAQAKVQNAKEKLRVAEDEANAVAQQVAKDRAWELFKSDAGIKIRKNELLIEDFKVKMKTTGKTLKAQYEKRIAVLEQKNKELKTRMDAYEKNQSDWESFKRQFNIDLEKLGKALKNIEAESIN